jgi:hypothetical protein
MLKLTDFKYNKNIINGKEINELIEKVKEIKIKELNKNKFKF